MDAFSYLSVLLSIILGLAITQVLQGLRGLMHARRRLRMYAPTMIWALLLLVVFVQSWWSEFGLRRHESWTFLGFSVVVAHSLFLYMLGALVLPDVHGDEPVDLREHYYDSHRWFFSFVVLAALAGIAKDLVLEGMLPKPSNLAFQLSFTASGVIGAITRREWYHQLFAPAAVLAFGCYIALLFSQLD
jgi:hypothetical protein